MEEKKEQSEEHEHHEHTEGEHSEHHEEHKSEVKKDPFSTFGKIVAAVIVIALLIGGGIFLGQTFKQSSNPEPTPTSQTNPTSPTQSAALSPTTTSPTQSAAALDKSTTAGGASGTSYKVYQVDYPSSWSVAKEKTDLTDKLTLTKGAYSISIYQAPMGGGGCTYAGDPEQEMSQSYKNYAEIQGSTYKLRRSWNEAVPTTFAVCASSDGKTWGSPTSYGAISVKVPNPTDPATMKEVDAILASLTSK